jgi:hypothetical protein
MLIIEEETKMALKSARRLAGAAWEKRVDPEPRSAEFEEGWISVFAAQISHEPLAPCPFEPGTAQADAWHAGVNNGLSHFHIKGGQNPVT